MSESSESEYRDFWERDVDLAELEQDFLDLEADDVLR